MSTHNTVVPPVDENDEAGAPYAESIVIDEGGIDLKIDGETIVGASFEGLDSYQLAYAVLPENFIVPSRNTFWLENVGKLVTETDKYSDTDLELGARAFLTALARRKGFEK